MEVKLNYYEDHDNHVPLDYKYRRDYARKSQYIETKIKGKAAQKKSYALKIIVPIINAIGIFSMYYTFM